jgi:Sec-independent protein translocase protein TatA
MFVVLWARIVGWAFKAWGWLKKNWQWVLLPVGLLLLLSRLRPRAPEVVSSSLIGAGETQRAAEQRADEQVEEARAELDEKVEQAAQEHQSQVRSLVEKQKDDAAELAEDPQRLNAFLLNVGKETRK